MAGRYRLGQLLGTGGMGQVFEARHLMTGRQVALKRIAASSVAAHPDLERRVLMEASACGAVDHPNVVQILDGGWTPEGDLFLVFEHLRGQTLEAALKNRRIAPRDLLRCAVRLLDALGAVHESGWVHRDVKPANVFLARGRTGHLEVKLLDFGIAARPEDARPEDGVMGTLEYMSPEQALSDPFDGRADVWSLGAVLFRGLTGRVPYPAKTPAERARSLRQPSARDPREVRPELPADVSSIVSRCLAPEPERRFDVEAAVSALLAVDEEALAQLRPPEPAYESDVEPTESLIEHEAAAGL